MIRALPLLLLIAACSRPEPALPNDEGKTAAPAPPQPVSEVPAPGPAAADQPTASGADAAERLRLYYALIGEGRYAEAWTMHAPGEQEEGGAERLAAAFADRGSLHATIGAPSQAVEADGAIWVEVPVQTYGRLRDGSPFSSAGTVTLRREGSGPWRIAGC